MQCRSMVGMSEIQVTWEKAQASRGGEERPDGWGRDHGGWSYGGNWSWLPHPLI